MAIMENVCNENDVTLSIKICGLTRQEDIECAERCGADFLGFIIEAKSSRRLTVEQAAALVKSTQPAARIVAVTVNPDDDLLSRITLTLKPDYIQLHGDETPERVAEIKARYKSKIIKALPISEASDLDVIPSYDADMILLDAKPPKGGARGGHGFAFDWNMLKNATLPAQWALAGGITPENAARAAAMTNAPILDVSSGVEAAPGIKDGSKIKALIDAVKHGQTG